MFICVIWTLELISRWNIFIPPCAAEKRDTAGQTGFNGEQIVWIRVSGSCKWSTCKCSNYFQLFINFNGDFLCRCIFLLVEVKKLIECFKYLLLLTELLSYFVDLFLNTY